jgi:hypothetical protein
VDLESHRGGDSRADHRHGRAVEAHEPAEAGAELKKGPDPVAASFSGQERRFRGLSDDTWVRAVEELTAKGLIEVGKVTRGGEELDWRRERKSCAVVQDKVTGLQELIDFDVMGKAEAVLL